MHNSAYVKSSLYLFRPLLEPATMDDQMEPTDLKTLAAGSRRSARRGANPDHREGGGIVPRRGIKKYPERAPRSPPWLGGLGAASSAGTQRSGGQPGTACLEPRAVRRAGTLGVRERP